jgi:hypothetical protein
VTSIGADQDLLETGAVATACPAAPALKSVAGVEPGATLVTQLSDGKIWSRVERTSNDACQT